MGFKSGKYIEERPLSPKISDGKGHGMWVGAAEVYKGEQRRRLAQELQKQPHEPMLAHVRAFARRHGYLDAQAAGILHFCAFYETWWSLTTFSTIGNQFNGEELPWQINALNVIRPMTKGSAPFIPGGRSTSTARAKTSARFKERTRSRKVQAVNRKNKNR